MLLGLVVGYQHMLDGIGWWNKPPDYGPPTPVGNIRTPTVFGVTSVKEPIYLLLLFLFVPCPCWFLIILGKLQKFVLKNFTFTTLKPGTAVLVDVVLLCFWEPRLAYLQGDDKFSQFLDNNKKVPRVTLVIVANIQNQLY